MHFDMLAIMRNLGDIENKIHLLVEQGMQLTPYTVENVPNEIADEILSLLSHDPKIALGNAFVKNNRLRQKIALAKIDLHQPNSPSDQSTEDDNKDEEPLFHSATHISNLPEVIDSPRKSLDSSQLINNNKRRNWRLAGAFIGISIG